MTLVQEMWKFAVSQGKQFMDCIIFSKEKKQILTNRCFLQIQKEFLNMNIDEKEGSITVIMSDHSENEIQNLFNGYVVTDQLTLNLKSFESGSSDECQDKIGPGQEMPHELERRERKMTFQTKQTTIKSYLCYVCGKEFSNSRKLTVHKYQVHSNNQEAYTCKICHKVMKTKSNLHTHMYIHAEPRFCCINCSRVWIVDSH